MHVTVERARLRHQFDPIPELRPARSEVELVICEPLGKQVYCVVRQLRVLYSQGTQLYYLMTMIKVMIMGVRIIILIQ